ncbi:UDP-3-O-(3-hydroxymyristoyl)glucosamine N-acyltransferase [[Eubacterium] hominis]|uniref:UDP-3-O-(3-hydroxymyristoyl)glucosamine N-acyltransferase n=1 Tax=[Eubacterium] hominis TaxID=2764325 RepID=UPI003A4E6046
MLLSDIFQDNIIRNGSFEVLGILDSKSEQKMLTFLEKKQYISQIKEQSNIGCIITTRDFVEKILAATKIGIYVCENPRIKFFQLHNCLSTDIRYQRKKHKTIIGKNCKISPLACISQENVIIGDNVEIEEFVSIKENTIIKDNCIIRSGTVVGSTGFEFKKYHDLTFGVRHCGGVILNENVEVQHNCCIDKAVYPWDDTVIGKYTKFDNLVHIGHAAKIGDHVLFPAGTTVSGRVEIADGVWIGVGSTISNGISFGRNSRCNIGSVVTKDVPENGSVSGNFAIEHEKFIENLKKAR